jgi:preprotein translocase subunit SecD
MIAALVLVALAGCSEGEYYSYYGDTDLTGEHNERNNNRELSEGEYYSYYGDTDLTGEHNERNNNRELMEAVFSPAAGYSPTIAELEETRAVIEARMSLENVRNFDVHVDYDTNEIVVRGRSFDTEMLVMTALLTFREGLPELPQSHEDLPLVITGADVEKATPQFMVADNEYSVSLELKESGREAFAEVTERLAGTLIPISIWLDDYCISAPMVFSRIDGGNATISGHFTEDEVILLANKINSGTLPFKLEIDSLNLVSSTD